MSARSDDASMPRRATVCAGITVDLGRSHLARAFGEALTEEERFEEAAVRGEELKTFLSP